MVVKCDSRRLVGFSNGKMLYRLQLSGVLAYKYKETILFPRHVEHMSISFIDGLMSEVCKHIDRKDISKYIVIEGNDNIVEKFNSYFSIFFK